MSEPFALEPSPPDPQVVRPQLRSQDWEPRMHELAAVMEAWTRARARGIHPECITAAARSIIAELAEFHATEAAGG